ncbi:MFS transporter [Paenibacillus kobensis]|uniref:MFS transporter n=1 Tax=Paenibacillus kobensis TaxID=59841 RepID=UPI000FDA1BBC|nr:MFS transporter [Paenibacillus kobensis]
MPSHSRHTIEQYIQSPERLRQLYRRTLAVVIISQLLGGAGLAAGVTVGALLAQDMLGTESYAGLPTALLTLGSAVAALMVGRLTQRSGRRAGLATGFLLGGAGAVGIIAAAAADQVWLLFLSFIVYGAGTATNLQARYAGSDLALPSQRAKSISLALVSTTFGAVAGPSLVEVTGHAAESVGLPTLAGPFMLGAVAFTLAGLFLLAFLRPDPHVIAKAIAQAQLAEGSQTAVARQTNKRGIVIGASVMIITQAVMVSIMTMTPIHMKHHGHSLGDVGLVIGIHVAAMYLPSIVTGALIDRIGRTAMVYAAGLTLLSAGLVAALSPSDSMPLLILALALLGLGWNIGLISGTTLIVDSTDPATRAKTQGSVDVFVSLSGASGGVLSGMVVAGTSYAMLSLGGSLLSLILIPIVVWNQSTSRQRA